MALVNQSPAGRDAAKTFSFEQMEQYDLESAKKELIESVNKYFKTKGKTCKPNQFENFVKGKHYLPKDEASLETVCSLFRPQDKSKHPVFWTGFWFTETNQDIEHRDRQETALRELSSKLGGYTDNVWKGCDRILFWRKFESQLNAILRSGDLLNDREFWIGWSQLFTMQGTNMLQEQEQETSKKKSKAQSPKFLIYIVGDVSKRRPFEERFFYQHEFPVIIRKNQDHRLRLLATRDNAEEIKSALSNHPLYKLRKYDSRNLESLCMKQETWMKLCQSIIAKNPTTGTNL